MSVVEIRSTIDEMTEEERFFAKAYLHHLDQRESADYREKIASRRDKDSRVSREQLLRAHETSSKANGCL